MSLKTPSQCVQHVKHAILIDLSIFSLSSAKFTLFNQYPCTKEHNMTMVTKAITYCDIY